MVHAKQISWLMWPRVLAMAILLLARPLVAAQDPPPSSKSEPNYAFFSGTVEDFSEARIVVSRVLPGKPTETRSFVINADTKVEGQPKAKARVTVGFETRDEGDVAVRIIVRPATKR